MLELVRWAPSASNKQPWRIVRGADGRHLYLQRVDVGIAMCHFELAAREAGLTGRWEVRDPELPIPKDGVEYTVSWRQ